MSATKLVNIFFSHASTMGYVFRTGRTIHFHDHQYTTTNQAEIDELNEVCQEAGSAYYVKPDQLTVDPAMLDPMAVIYAKMLEKARLEVAVATNPERDGGNTEQGKLEGIANSLTIRGLTADSSSTAPVATSAVATSAVATKK